MTVTPYTEPQIDPTVTIPWPTQVNAKLAEHRQEIADLKAHVADLDRRIRELEDRQRSAIRNPHS